MIQKIDYNVELLKFWKKAEKLVEEGNLVEADEAYCTCLVILAHATEKGYKRIWDTSIDIAKNRVWLRLEELGLLPD